MATWTYNTFDVAAVAASAAGSLALATAIGAGLDAASGWSVASAASNYDTDNGRVVMSHTGGAKLAVALSAVVAGRNVVASGQHASGSAVTDGAQPICFAYVPSGTLPTSPTSGSLPSTSFLYSTFTGTAFVTSSTSRWHVWASNEGALIIAVQRTTASSTINEVGFFGPCLASPVFHSSDSGSTARLIQWTFPSFTTVTNSAIGTGQAFSATGTRILSFSPYAASAIMASTVQAAAPYALSRVVYAKSSASLASDGVIANHGVKGEFDTDALMLGPSSLSLRATLSSQTRIHLGQGYFVPWASAWGSMT